MEWTDSAIVLSARRHGEGSAVVSLLTHAHGRHAGLVRGIQGKNARGLYQPGNLLTARWRGRLEEHLGFIAAEPLRLHAATLLTEPLRLAGLMAACAMAETLLPEREPHPAVFDGLGALLDALEEPGDGWPGLYVRWELGLLGELGFGLDLSACAATGGTDDLAYVSPKTGRAVSRAAGLPYADKLLPLPAFLTRDGEGQGEALRQGFDLAAWFIEHHVLSPAGQVMPAARQRFVDRCLRSAVCGGTSGEHP